MGAISLTHFLTDMLILCKTHNGSVTSWIRSEKRNTEVGGVPGSLHVYGYAVDVVFDSDEDRTDGINFAKSRGYDVVTYATSSHIHVEADPHIL